MMKLTKSSRAFRRATAIALATAMTFSVPVANNASAAEKKVPSLSATKKTLYVKGGTKSFTLKVKKNKAKKIVKTVWTTSKKSVAKISKKKATSVKVTAVKKGSAKINAKVTYKVGKKTKTKTLTCKVTVKAKKAAAATEAPATEAPATEAPATDAPATEAPVTGPAIQVADKVEITSKDDVKSVGVVEKFNELELTAKAVDADGKEMEKQPEFTWASSDEKVATVKDGKVTGVAEGKATITATAKVDDKEVKGEFEVTVDATAPKIAEDGIVFTDYKTLTITFDEEVEGEKLVAKINGAALDAKQKVAIDEKDKKVVTITNEDGFSAGKMLVAFENLTDKNGNKFESKNFSVEKKASVVSAIEFVSTGLAPNGKKATANIKVTDQYGQDMTSKITNGVFGTNTITVTATLSTGLKLTTTAVDSNGTFDITAPADFTSGQNIDITVVAKNGNDKTAEVTKTLSVGAAAAAASIVKITSDKGATFVADTSAIAATLTADVRDQYNNPCKASLTWQSTDGSVVSFAATAKDATNTTMNNSVAVYALKAGTATISAYLPNGTKVLEDLTITVKTDAVASVTVAKGVSIDQVSKAAATTYAVNSTDANVKNNVNFADAKGNTVSVLAEDVTFEVTSANEKLYPVSNVNIVKAQDANGNLSSFDVSVNLTSQDVTAKDTLNNGNAYTVTVKAKKADGSFATSKFTVNAKYDNVPVSMQFGADTKINSGGTITVPLTFKNQYGEFVAVQAQDIQLIMDSGIQTATAMQLANDKVVATGTDAVGALKVETKAGITANNYKVYVMVNGSTSGTFTGVISDALLVNVTGEKTLKAVTFADSVVNVISGNTVASGVAGTDKVTVANGKAYTLVPVTFTDNDGEKFTVKPVAAKQLQASPNGAAGKVMDVSLALAGGADISKVDFEFFKADGAVATTADAVEYIGFYNVAAKESSSSVTVKFTDASDNTKVIAETSSLYINTKEARKLQSIEVKSDIKHAIVGQNIALSVAGKDQYGADYAVNFAGLDSVASDGASFDKTTGKVSATKAGTHTVTFTDAATKTTFKYEFVAVTETAVDKIVIQPTVNSDGVNYDSANYKVKVADGKAITASVKAYVGNDEVVINNGDIDFTYVATPAQNSALAVDADGTVTKAGAGTVKISATQKFSTAKIEAVTINVDGAAAAATTNTGFATKNDKGVYTNVASVSVAKGSAAGAKSTTVYLHAIDQYGKDFVYDVAIANTALIGAPAGATMSVASNAITITSAGADTSAAGSATLRVVLGTNVYDIAVTIA